MHGLTLFAGRERQDYVFSTTQGDIAMTQTIEINEERLEAFGDQVLGDLAACYGGVMVSLGDKLGLYEALRGAGPLNSDEVAERSGCAERYVREWLNPPGRRRLPPLRRRRGDLRLPGRARGLSSPIPRARC